MRVLVTGAAGRIGRHVVAELLRHDHEVHGLDRAGPPDDLAGGMAGWHQSELNDVEAFAGLVGDIKANAVVHLAAIPSPLRGTPQVVFTTNTRATFVVLEGAGIAGVSRVAFASSTSVTGLPFADPPLSPLYVPLDEAHPNIGSDAYALSKETDEATARTMYRRHGYQVVGLRISNTSPMDYQVAEAAKVAADSSYLAGELWAYLDVRDGARAFRLAIEREIPGCHLINVMAPDTYSTEPTADLLARHHPSTEVRAEIPGREVAFDLTRSRELLDFEAEYLLPR